MAKQNLLEYADNNFPLLTVGGIHQFLDNANGLVKPQTINASSLLKQRIDEFQTMIDNYQQREKRFYEKFNINPQNLIGLQAKIDDINSNLIMFSNKALRRFPLVEKMSNSTSIDTLQKRFEKELSDWVDNSQVIADVAEDKAIEAIAGHMVELFDNKYSAKEIAKILEKKKRRSKNGAFRFKKGTLKDYKEDLLVYYKEIDDNINGTKFDFSAEYNPMALISGNEDLSYYPYYKLTQEEQQFAKTNTSLWIAFCHQLAKMAGKYEAVAFEVLTNERVISVSDFFVGSANELIGVMGELQTLIIFAVLFGDEKHAGDRFLDYVGNATKNGKKVGVDVIVEGEGIQVKNYNPYGELGKNQGINLRNSVSLNYFLDQLSGVLGQEQISTIAEFYTLRAYHTRETEEYDPTLSRLQIFDNRVKDFFQGYIDQYLPLDNLETVEKEGRELAYGDTNNLFYFIAGRLVPVSKILLGYKKYMELLLDGINSKARRTFTVTPIYHGKDTYHAYWEKYNNGEGEDYKAKFGTAGYQNVYEEMVVDYTININIDYVLEEILFRE